MDPRRPQLTAQDRHRATYALERLARQGRVRIQDPTVRATVFALAEANLIKTQPRRKSVPNLPAIGAQRRLQALAHDGWAANHVAEVIGMSDRAIKMIRSGQTTRIQAATHEAIRQLYETGISSEARPQDAGRARATAERAGWATRSAWVGKDIDNPDSSPDS